MVEALRCQTGKSRCHNAGLLGCAIIAHSLDPRSLPPKRHTVYPGGSRDGSVKATARTSGDSPELAVNSLGMERWLSSAVLAVQQPRHRFVRFCIGPARPCRCEAVRFAGLCRESFVERAGRYAGCGYCSPVVTRSLGFLESPRDSGFEPDPLYPPECFRWSLYRASVPISERRGIPCEQPRLRVCSPRRRSTKLSKKKPLRGD